MLWRGAWGVGRATARGIPVRKVQRQRGGHARREPQRAGPGGRHTSERVPESAHEQQQCGLDCRALCDSLTSSCPKQGLIKIEDLDCSTSSSASSDYVRVEKEMNIQVDSMGASPKGGQCESVHGVRLPLLPLVRGTDLECCAQTASRQRLALCPSRRRSRIDQCRQATLLTSR